MPNASRRTCDYPGCDSGPPDANNLRGPYVTSLDNVRREEVTDDLKNHVEMAHLLPIRLEEAATKKIEAEANKLLAEAQRIQADREPVVQQPQAGAGHPPPDTAQRRFNEKRDVIPRPRVEENIT